MRISNPNSHAASARAPMPSFGYPTAPLAPQPEAAHYDPNRFGAAPPLATRPVSADIASMGFMSPMLASDPTLQAEVIQATARGFGDSREPLVASNGELNASTRADLMRQMQGLMERVSGGQFTREAVASTSPVQRAEMAKVRRQKVHMALNDSREQAALGAELATEITSRVTRMGFTRRLLLRGDTINGTLPRIRCPENNVRAVVATGPTEIGYEIIRDKWIIPSEFYIEANPRIEMKDLIQGSGDLLEETFLDAQQAVLVTEDRTFMKQIDAAASIYNGITYFTGQLTPAVLAQLQENINLWGYPVSGMLMAMDLIKDINTGSAFNDFLEPVSRLEIILTGRLGTLLGMDIMTDGFRDKRLKVLDPGEILVTAPPQYLGAYTDRGPLQADPRSNDKDFPGKGWYMWEMFSSTVANARAVSKAQRI